MLRLFWVVWIAFLLPISAACKKETRKEIEIAAKSFAKNTPHPINYDNLSLLLQDMRAFARALKPLNLDAVERIDDRYDGVFFTYQTKPLFVNVYPNPESSQIVFLIAPKDPETGSNPLLTFDKKLPIVDSETIEIQLRTANPEQPIDCYLKVPDTAAYMKEVQNRLYTAKYLLYKRFKQSGTYDFDALTLPAYRLRGYPFIVFDVVKVELTDTTAKLTTECR